MSGQLDVLMDRLGYRFKDPALLQKALTHSSYANEGRGSKESNERLEFLGDSVLGFVTAGYLFHKDRGPEGELTKLRAALVCEKALHSYSAPPAVRRGLPLWPTPLRPSPPAFTWTAGWRRPGPS